jgi:hypothetical protein
MTFNNFDAVFFTVGFLVPGFVWSAVLAMIVPDRTSGEVRFLGYLTLSCINHALWSWALWLIFKTNLIDTHPYWSAAWLFVIMFLSPVGLGLLSGWLRQRDAVLGLLRRFGFRTIDPTPTAWDWHFARLRPYWVVVTLKDGARIHGLLGTESFAASDPKQHDLYLEAQFEPLPNGEWAPVEDTGGVLILSDQIATIEFRKLTEEDYDE